MQALGFDQKNARWYTLALTLMSIGCAIILATKIVDFIRGGDVGLFSVFCYLTALGHTTLASHRIRRDRTRISERFATALITSAIAVASGGERFDVAGLMAASGTLMFGISRALGEKANVPGKTRFIEIKIPWIR